MGLVHSAHGAVSSAFLEKAVYIESGDATMKPISFNMERNNYLQAMTTNGASISPNLLVFHELPPWRKDSEYLLSGYR